MEPGIEKKYVQAGSIAAEIFAYARKIVKPEIPVLVIAEKIEERIFSLGEKPAFPVDVSCDEIAAHYSPLWQDKNVAKGLVKIDFGVAVDGYLVDSALSIDLTAEQKYKALIKSAEDALAAAIRIVRGKRETAVRDIGREIHRVITANGFSPIRNLSGHEVKQYNLHAGLNLPNYDNGNEAIIHDGVYAIEPFATAGIGIVQEGKPSGIFQLKEKKPVRDMQTRKILQFIEQEYKTLPFAARWLAREFSSRALLSLQMLEQQGCLHQFPQLIEKSRMPVSQAEKTILIAGEKVVVLGED
jgi:methionyl aminopeptidase